MRPPTVKNPQTAREREMPMMNNQHPELISVNLPWEMSPLTFQEVLSSLMSASNFSASCCSFLSFSRVDSRVSYKGGIMLKSSSWVFSIRIEGNEEIIRQISEDKVYRNCKNSNWKTNLKWQMCSFRLAVKRHHSHVKRKWILFVVEEET